MVQHGLYLGAIERRRFLIVEPIPNSNRVVLSGDERLLDWMADRIMEIGDGHDLHGRAQAIGFGENGRILAVLAVTGMDSRKWNAELSLASVGGNWATRGILKKIFSYPFEQLGVGRVTAVCRVSNTKIIRFCLKLGFKQEGVLRRFRGDEDAIVLGMLREEAERWLRYSPASDTNAAYSMAATAV
jgi:RimJ/RimL family protein N-acetyltransferase